MADVGIFRRDLTVYIRNREGTDSVLFHLRAADEYHIANADKLVSLALICIHQAPPEHLFFDLK